MNPKLPEVISDDSLLVVREAIEELQSERGAFEGFVTETLDFLESLREKLQTHELEISERNTALEKKESGLHEALEQLEAKAAVGADYEARISELEQEARDLKKSRDAVKKKLDSVTEELASMADLLELVEATEEELQETKTRLEETRAELAERGDSSERVELKELKQQCGELEHELQDSRDEVARLTKKSREQSDELNTYRKKWLNELQEMKEALKDRSTKLAQEADQAPEDGPWEDEVDSAAASSESSHEPAARETAASQTESSESADDDEPDVPKSSDPVIGSVLNELAKLEKAAE